MHKTVHRQRRRVSAIIATVFSLLLAMTPPDAAADAAPASTDSVNTSDLARLPTAIDDSQANPSPKPAPAIGTGTTGAHSVGFWNLRPQPNAYAIVGASSGLSLHKPMYIEPATYSPQYNGSHTEAVFQISLKLQAFNYPRDGALYFGYTQKSFFDAYDKADSSPFRETDYNPEAFYRYIPSDVEKWHHLGLDFGIEHNSNGKSLPDSRSWNRIYIAPFQAEGNHLIYFKVWWRLPENKNLPRTDPRRDDNPDIQDYYGYSQLEYEQQFFGDQLAQFTVRFNPRTNRGAIAFNYSIPGPGNHFFWGFFFFNGYGDSLIDYNHSVTRVGLGIMLTR